MNAPLVHHLTAAAALMLAAMTQTSFAQPATTTPVGFVTISIAGNGGFGRPAYTFTSLGILHPVVWQSTATSVGTNTVTDTVATWADNAYNSATLGAPPTHFLEIISTTAGLNVGTRYDVVTTANASHTLTVALPNGMTSLPNDIQSYAIRPHWTIASVFGTGPGLQLSGGTHTSADQVQLFNNGGYVSYYYQTSGAGGTGWRNYPNVSTDVSNTVIYPDVGIVIARQQTAVVSLVLSGAVKTGQTSIPVQSGYSLLGNVYSAGMTLDNSNLVVLLNSNAATPDTTNGLAGGNHTSADQVLFWNGTGFTSYYYQTSGAGGIGWRNYPNISTNASNTTIPIGAALFIQRAGAAFNWIAPQAPVSFN